MAILLGKKAAFTKLVPQLPPRTLKRKLGLLPRGKLREAERFAYRQQALPTLSAIGAVELWNQNMIVLRSENMADRIWSNIGPWLDLSDYILVQRQHRR